MSDDRERSTERAKESALQLAATGLSALFPGSGALAVRLAKHVIELVVEARLRRVQEFNQRVLEGEGITDVELTARLGAMRDEDFKSLLASMFADLEAEKVPIYSAAYIYLVERHATLSRDEKLDFAFAVPELRLVDFEVLGRFADAGVVGTGSRKTVASVEGSARRGSTQRLAHVGAFTTGMGPHGPTDFGRDIVRALAPAINEALERRRR